MADREGKIIGDLGPVTRGSTEPRQEGLPAVWEIADGLADRMAAKALEAGLPGIAPALRWAFRLGQRVGQGSTGPAIGCPSCGLRAGFADPAGPAGKARCVCCDHAWSHGSRG